MDESEVEKIRELDVKFESKEVDISEGYKFEGFAELRSYKVLEVTDEIGDSSFKQNYIIFEALVHGRESAIVCVREDSDLYYFMLNITDSEILSQLSGKYLPVDKVSDGMYQPSESLFNDFESLDVKGDKFEKLKREMKCGHIEYSIEDT